MMNLRDRINPFSGISRHCRIPGHDWRVFHLKTGSTDDGTCTNLSLHCLRCHPDPKSHPRDHGIGWVVLRGSWTIEQITPQIIRKHKIVRSREVLRRFAHIFRHQWSLRDIDFQDFSDGRTETYVYYGCKYCWTHERRIYQGRLTDQDLEGLATDPSFRPEGFDASESL